MPGRSERGGVPNHTTSSRETTSVERGGCMRAMAALVLALSACSFLPVTGCKKSRTTTPDEPPAPAPAPPAAVNQAVPAAAVPAGWKMYTPPEGDFSVAVPGEPTSVRPKQETNQTVRTYEFAKGDALLRVWLFNRTGAGTQLDKFEDIPSHPGVVTSSIREVTLGGMPGREFSRNDPQLGEVLHRTYRSTDGTRAISLWVVKPKTLTDAEVRGFLDSFKLLK